MPKWWATSCTTVIRTSSLELGLVVAPVEQRVAEDEDPVGQGAAPHVAALGQGDAVVEPEEVVGLVLGRLVLDEHHDVADVGGDLVGDRVEGAVDQGLERLAIHLHRHGSMVPDRPLTPDG